MNFGSSPLVSQVCSNCITNELPYGVIQTTLPPTLEAIGISTWCLHVICPRCSTSWFACRQCSNIRTQLTTIIQVRRHADRNHPRKKRKGRVSSFLPATSAISTICASSLPTNDDSEQFPFDDNNPSEFEDGVFNQLSTVTMSDPEKRTCEI